MTVAATPNSEPRSTASEQEGQPMSWVPKQHGRGAGRFFRRIVCRGGRGPRSGPRPGRRAHRPRAARTDDARTGDRVAGDRQRTPRSAVPRTPSGSAWWTPKYTPVQIDILFGDPGYRIAEHAQRLGAELIVTPSHGRTGLERILLGSVAERVIRLSHCPVLVLRSSLEATRRSNSGRPPVRLVHSLRCRPSKGAFP